MVKELFAGRTDVFGIGQPDPDRPGKHTFRASYDELTDEVWMDHFTGKHCISIYPLVEDKVKWFAVDLDEAKSVHPDQDQFPLILEQAHRQVRRFADAGLFTYIERSRSGRGVHIWGFLSEWTDADVVRKAMAKLLVDETLRQRDRCYPTQSHAAQTRKRIGNALAVPFYGRVVPDGNSVFIDGETPTELVVYPPREWVKHVRQNHPDVLVHLAENVKAVSGAVPVISDGDAVQSRQKEFLPEGMLKIMSPYGCDFMRHCWEDRRTLSEPEWYAAIQQCTAFEHGRDIAHYLSRDYPKYSEAETNMKYEQALGNPIVSCKYIASHFPEHACGHCRVRAPFQLAQMSILEIVSTASGSMETLGSYDTDLEYIEQLNDGTLEWGWFWGMPSLDAVSRLRRSEMTVVGALPSIGKTWFMIDAAYRIAKSGIPVFVFSAETARRSLRMRFLSRAAKVESRALRGERMGQPLSGAEWSRLHDASQDLARLPIFTDYSAQSADSVLELIERTMVEQHRGLDDPYVVFFDYLQFGNKQPGESSDFERLSRLTSEFKYLAKITDHPIVVFSQLQRQHEGEENRPRLNWFKGTGRIELDMDVGFILTGERVEGDSAARTLWIVKQRESMAGLEIPFVLRQSYGEFQDVVPVSETGVRGLLEDDDDVPLFTAEESEKK